MRKLFVAFALILFALPASAEDRLAWGLMGVMGGTPAGGCQNTIYINHGYEASTNWYDGFSSYDDIPAGQMALDSGSVVGGTKSIKVDTAATSGATLGSTNFAQTVFYARTKIYISSTSSPTSDDGINVGGTGSQAASFLLFYDTDHFEVQVKYRLDSGASGYTNGADHSAGATISTDAVHTLYMYYKGGSGTDGEVWFKLDSGAWTTKTGLDINTKAAAVTTYEEVAYAAVIGGTPANHDFIYYLDDVLVQTCDPS